MGHTEGMDNQTLPRIIVEYEPKVRRDVGRGQTHKKLNENGTITLFH